MTKIPSPFTDFALWWWFPWPGTSVR